MNIFSVIKYSNKKQGRFIMNQATAISLKASADISETCWKAGFAK
jgi:hypothetical protein